MMFAFGMVQGNTLCYNQPRNKERHTAMKTNKYLTIALAAIFASALFANDARAGNDFLAGLLAGCLGMGIISAAANTPRSTVIYSEPAPVVYSTPSVYSSPVVYSTPSVYSSPVVYSQPAPVVVRRTSTVAPVVVRQPAPVVVRQPAVVQTRRVVAAPQQQVVRQTTVVAKPAPAPVPPRGILTTAPARPAPAPTPRPNSGGPIFSGR